MKEAGARMGEKDDSVGYVGWYICNQKAFFFLNILMFGVKSIWALNSKTFPEVTFLQFHFLFDKHL